MRDMIHIRDLTVPCIIGTQASERIQKQNVVVNITLECDLSAAGRSDDIADTVDYSALKNEIVALIEDSDFFLVEKLAARIAAVCLAGRRVEAVHVQVDKPGALTFARSVGVEVFRDRESQAGVVPSDV